MKLIMYSSTAVVKPGSAGMPAGLSSLVEHCKKQNRIHDVSGALYYSHGRYLQIIEGEDKVVDRLMVNILKDSRHEDCLIQIDTKIKERSFPIWQCKLVMVIPTDVHLRTFIARHSEKLKAMSSDSRIAFNHFFKKQTLKRDTQLANNNNSLTSLDVFGDKPISISGLPDLSGDNLAPLMTDICDLIKWQPHSVDQLVTELGTGKRYEILVLLKDLNGQGLIQFEEL